MRECQGFRWFRRVVVRQRLLFTVIKADRLAWHNGGNRMLIDKLGLTIAAQQNAEIVEPCDHALQFYTVNKEDGHRNFGLTHMVKKCVLKVLSIGSHCRSTLYCSYARVRGTGPSVCVQAIM
jgi:hypothetical protein